MSPCVQWGNFSVCVRETEIHAFLLWASVLIMAANWAVKPTSVLITDLLTALWAALQPAGATHTSQVGLKTQVMPILSRLHWSDSAEFHFVNSKF